MFIGVWRCEFFLVVWEFWIGIFWGFYIDVAFGIYLFQLGKRGKDPVIG